MLVVAVAEHDESERRSQSTERSDAEKAGDDGCVLHSESESRVDDEHDDESDEERGCRMPK